MLVAGQLNGRIPIVKDGSVPIRALHKVINAGLDTARTDRRRGAPGYPAAPLLAAQPGRLPATSRLSPE